MFILTIRLKGAEAPIVMHYETREAGEAGALRIRSGERTEDSFGHIAGISPDEISAIFVTDVVKDCEAQVRCQMIAQRAQADLQAKLANDPAMRLRASILPGRG